MFLSIIRPATAGPLDVYRWKNRLIIVSLPKNWESRDDLAAQLASGRSEIEERNLQVIDVSLGSTQIPQTLRLGSKPTQTLREKLNLSDSESRAIFILMGKDGREVARQWDTLDLAPWFHQIDQMPMRQQEMRQQEKDAE